MADVLKTVDQIFAECPHLVFYDFEVFLRFWCVVIVDAELRNGCFIADSHALIDYYNRHKDCVWVGFNSNHYDRYILSAAYYESSCDEIFRMSQELISRGYTERGSLIDGLRSYDTGDRFHSLKQYEAFMGHSIEESSIPFDYSNPMTEDQIAEIRKYCTHDVLETIEVFRRRIYDFEAQTEIIRMFHLPETAYALTKAQLTALVLKCSKYEQVPDIDGHFVSTIRDYSGEEWHDEILPCIHIERYTKVLEFFQSAENYKNDQKLNMDICGVPHTFGLGGIHGAVKKYHKAGAHMAHIDVTSYYPSIMIQYHLLTRMSQDPDLFKQIYDTRVQLKREGKKKEQAPYKIILNSTFGITNQKTSRAYDPRRNHEVCINGQLMLLMLLEMLEGHCRLIQSNTDGIIIDYNGFDLDEIKSICDRWCEITRMFLGYDYIDEIWQKDVNNYLFRFASGKYEAKGSYVKFSNDLDNDMPVVNEAVRQGLIANDPAAIDQYIADCNDLIKYQKVVKLTEKYRYVYLGGNPIENHKCFRIFAVKSRGEVITKQKVAGGTKAKFANVPENGTIVFGDLSDSDLRDYMGARFTIDRVDKDYYRKIAKQRYYEFLYNRKNHAPAKKHKVTNDNNAEDAAGGTDESECTV